METWAASPVTEPINQLGEGPTWDSRAQRLLWVDIDGCHVRSWSTSASLEAWKLPFQTSFLSLTNHPNQLIIGGREGIHRLDLETGQHSLFADPEPNQPANRFNDGKTDPHGCLWAGTINDQRAPICGLYRIHADRTFEQILTGVINSNGLCWSPDGQSFYYIDSGTRQIDRFDYEASTNSINNRQTIIVVPETMGKPDGMCIDQSGMLWVGMWGGAAVRRWNPATGEQIGQIDLPVSNVTSCCFGGSQLDKLYITTAQIGLPPDQHKAQPNAGALFACDVGIVGLPSHPFPLT